MSSRSSSKSMFSFSESSAPPPLTASAVPWRRFLRTWLNSLKRFWARSRVLCILCISVFSLSRSISFKKPFNAGRKSVYVAPIVNVKPAGINKASTPMSV
eukprot:CAMPEP_0204094238 /NCGR_PEP_ID=MMETSP0360-20130528/190827_1 /ASSEMBLY_ACC=CAM_ASM_000342 /TAXON_ID=268821 /ORGANISM="Scrippsiella Hangoei, Strain SHTV-5" /LENGTH=99 /DNA_ID=CAMNT_0051043547 /DNA_START=796 /DNA_END=1095 /DNA_ORIENTATION=+